MRKCCAEEPLNVFLLLVDSLSNRVQVSQSNSMKLIAVAMGKDFHSHLQKTIDIFTQLPKSLRTPDDDQLASYLLSAWARLAQVMGSEFTPFLHIVMPDLLKAAMVEPQVTILDGILSSFSLGRPRHIDIMSKRTSQRINLTRQKDGNS